MFEYIFGLIAPHLCLVCRREGSLLCPACLGLLTPPPPRCYRCDKPCGRTRICAACRPHTPLNAVIVATRYEDVAKTIVHKLKFERAGAASGPIARLMAAQLGRYLARRSSSGLRSNLTYAVVHAPTAHRRVRQRGYDQAARLAKRIACIHGLPYRSVLMRRGNTRQVGADKKKRRNQMQQAFYISRQGNCENTHALLVDDVLTTGATLESAANTLKQAGAGRVTAVVFAMAGVSTREDH